MRFVKPQVFLIGKTKPEPDGIQDWLQRVGCDTETVSRYAYQSYSGQKTSGEALVELAGRRCYLSFQPGLNPNVERIREDVCDYCTNILKSRHGSVLAHVWFNFAIEGVSRVFTGEMNRHGVGSAISEGSMRYIRYEDVPIVETPMLEFGPGDEEIGKSYEYTSWALIPEHNMLAVKKYRTRQIFRGVTEAIEKGYRDLQAVWADELKPDSKFADKKHVTSMMRRIIPMGVATGGCWSYNIRSLRNILEQRCSEAAEEEIAVVAGMMLEIMTREEPNFFKDFQPNERGYFTPVYSKV